MTEVSRSPSFSLRRSFDVPGFRRRTGGTAPSSPPEKSPSPPTTKGRPRAASAQQDDRKGRLVRQKSVRDFFRQHVSNRLPRRQSFDAKNHGDVDDQIFADDLGTRREESSATFAGTAGFQTSQSAQPTGQVVPLHPDRLSTVLEIPSRVALDPSALLRMFTGAPSFVVTGSREYPRPHAIYQDTASTDDNDIHDFLDFQHDSFRLATLHLTNGSTFLGSLEKTCEAVLEVPSMLSLNGSEPGSVGMKHFLDLPTSDGAPSRALSNEQTKQDALLNDPNSLGFQHLQAETILDRLAELGVERAARDQSEGPSEIAANDQKIEEMHSHLFSKLLVFSHTAPTVDPAPASLDIQISALLKALNSPGLWVDFSNPESRLHLGQILWLASVGTDEEQAISDRNMLLFQVTLAGELLARLELKRDLARKSATPEDELSKRKEIGFTRKLVWDLILAKRFLQAVRVAADGQNSRAADKRKSRSSVFSALSFVTAKEDFDEEEACHPVFYPRHEKSQIDGLQAFATSLDWPVQGELERKISSLSLVDKSESIDAYVQPVATPHFRPDDRPGYFGVLIRPTTSRMVTSHSLELRPPAASTDQIQRLNMSGWMSRSWLTGLILPGDTTSHLLMATLLENTVGALRALGETPNFSGGFYYKGKSYWSKTCVVGRVLGAMMDARDCIGWISVPRRTDNQPDGWVSIDSQPVPWTAQARIKALHSIADDSTPYPPPEAQQKFEDDFSWPSDGPPDPNSQVQAITLVFQPSERTFELPGAAATADQTHDKDDPTRKASAIATSTAIMEFSPPPSTRGLQRTALQLKHDVYFVASQPCFPPPRAPATPAVRSAVTSLSRDKELPAPPCHPLHKRYRWEVVPALAILGEDARLSRLERGGAGAGGSVQDTKAAAAVAADGDDTEGNVTVTPSEPVTVGRPTSSSPPEESVLVVDARGVNGLQLLVRAWCASVGQHALIGRATRTCIACCVREAKALGIKVIIRV